MTSTSAPEIPEEARRIPFQSLKSQTPEVTNALRDRLYLDELERQAVIVNNNIAFAWRRAMAGCSATDPETWAALQSALFASIIVQRVLKPARVHKYPCHQSQKESQTFAQNRGRHLRELLGVPEDASFGVDKVRDPFEHVDERLDQLMTADPVSVSDWYISTGIARITGAAGYGLRVFYPEGGILCFGAEALDLYKMDLFMLDLREAIPEAWARLEDTIQGHRNIFGGGRFVYLMPKDDARQRAASWLAEREQRGQGLGVRMEGA